jgi:hypothetical protein
MLVSSLFVYMIIAVLSSAAGATQLTLRCAGDRGRPVPLSHAELLLVAWGDVERLPLEIQGSRVVVPLAPEWLQTRWGRFVDMEKAYLFLQAAGYAPLRSEPFLWLGSHGGPHGPMVEQIEIAFPRNGKTIVRNGESAETQLKFRRPEKRTLRTIDEHGDPVAGVRIDAYMFWSNSNHCGFLAGADPLGRVLTDGKGRAHIPDGDFEYAFELLGKQHYVLKDPPEDYEPMRLITHLLTKETVLRLHRARRIPLHMQVTVNQKPAPGQWLHGRAAHCGCGACDGGLAKTDARGMIRIQDFYPEELEKVYFQRDGEEIWSADPNHWPGDRIVHVELPGR